MLKHVAVACVALAFATQAASQSIIEKAKQRQAQEQKAQQPQQKAQQQQQQQQASDGQAGAGASNSLFSSKRCNRSADGKKLSGEARKRYVDQCMKGKP